MNRIFFLLLLLLAACDNDASPDSDPCADNLTATFESCSVVRNVTADKCILQEVIIVRESDGYIFDRFVYHHDGTNYDRIDRYYFEKDLSPLAEPPAEVHNLTYQDNGLISEVSYTMPTIFPGSTWAWKYTYGEGTLKKHLDFMVDGVTTFSQDMEEFFVATPEDSLYFYDGRVFDFSDARAVFDYKDGNLIRMGRPAKDGFCVINGVHFHFRKNYYDDIPNVLKDFAMWYPFEIGKGLNGVMLQTYPLQPSANNIVGRIGDDGLNTGEVQYCWTFLKNGADKYWVKQFEVKGRGNRVTYKYDCE